MTKASTKKTTRKPSSNQPIEADAIVIADSVDAIKQQELKNHTLAIIDIERKSKMGMLEVAYRLGDIFTHQYYQLDGFKTVAEYGEKILGYKKSMVSKAVKASAFIVNKDGAYYTTFDDGTDSGNFGLTQLYELMRLTTDNINALISANRVSATNTCASIRTVVDSVLNGTLTITDDGKVIETPKAIEGTTNDNDSTDTISDASVTDTVDNNDTDNHKSNTSSDGAKYVMPMDMLTKKLDTISASDLATLFDLVSTAIVSRDDMVLNKRLSDSITSNATKIKERFIK